MRNRNRGSLLGGSSAGSFHNRNLYRCFCCFHVRSGALALGTWHLMIHLFAICLLAYMSANMEEMSSMGTSNMGSLDSGRTRTQTLTIVIRRANLTEGTGTDTGNKMLRDAGEASDDSDPTDTDSSSTDAKEDEPVAMPVSLNTGSGVRPVNKDKEEEPMEGTRIVVRTRSAYSNRDMNSPSLASYYWSSFVLNSAGQPVLSQRDLNLAFLLGCISVSIALMMLVGITKGRPAYLIPFLTYQMMDLIVSCLTVAGLICYGPQLKDYMLNDADFPFREEVSGLDSQWATLIAAVVVLSVVFIKAYFVQVVWLCLRFLKEEQVRRVREDCQPKVIYLDNQHGHGSGQEHAGDAASHLATAQQPELTMFVFDDQGNLVKKVPPPAYETSVDGDNTAAPIPTTGTPPPAYTYTA